MKRYLEKYKIYDIEEIDEALLVQLVNSCDPSASRCSSKYQRFNRRLKSTTVKHMGKNKHVTYVNVYSGFDIETTKESETLAFMYVWMLSLGSNVILGDTWEQFEVLIQLLKKCCDLDEYRRMLIYVHNLSYEFSFMKYIFKDVKVTASFLKSETHPLTITLDGCIEIRDSLALTNTSLDGLVKNYDISIPKLKGDLDYSKLRYSREDLTEQELPYCYHDVLILSEFSERYVFGQLIPAIKHKKVIPLTSTSILRNRIYDMFIDIVVEQLGLSSSYVKKHIDIFNDHCIIPNTFDEYQYLMNFVYMGGVSKAMSDYTGLILDESSNIGSKDITSSYPYVMLTYKFPYKRTDEHINTIEEALALGEDKSCIIEVAFKKLRCKNGFSFIPISKLLHKWNVIDDNRKVYAADECILACTNVDLQSIAEAYEWEDALVTSSEVYQNQYLPYYYVKPIYEAYINKQKLKEAGLNYTTEKAVVNSSYGLTVQRLCVDSVEFTTDLDFQHSRDAEGYSIEQLYEDYKLKSILSPLWGVFISAYARRHLLSVVNHLIDMGHDVIYVDTDSVKILNCDEEVETFFLNHNNEVAAKVKEFCKRCELSDQDGYKYFYGPNGLGQWEHEYDKILKFKTLGAKRYIMDVVKDGKIKTVDTIAGLPKNELTRYCEKHGLDRYEEFTEGLCIPNCDMSHSYINYPQVNSKGVIVPSCTVLSECDFTLDIEQMYINFLMNYSLTSFERRVL